MAQAYINGFAPLTPIGASLQNIALAFLGDNPRAGAKDAAITAANQAHARAYEAQATKLEAEAQAARAAEAGRRNFLANTYNALVPSDDQQAVRNFVTNTPVMAFEGGVQPRPSTLTPDMETQIRRAHLMDPMVQAGSPRSTIKNIAEAYTQVQNQDFADRTANGQMSPTRFIQLKGRNPYGIQGDTLANLAEGFLGPTTPLGQEKINTQVTAQKENQAQAGAAGAAAGASNARARLSDAHRDRVVQGTDTPLEPVQTDAGVVLQPRTKAVGAAAGARPTAGGKGAQEKAPTGPLLKGVEDVIAQEEKSNGAFDALTRRGIKARATQLMNDPKSPTHNNPAGSVQAAISEGGGFDGGKNTIMPDDPRKAKTPVGVSSAAAPKAPAAAAPAKRPAGATDDALIKDANAAIQRGANRDAVMKRLKDMGVQVQ